MPRGGRRAGAGRKSNTEIKTMRLAMDTVFSTDQWHDLLRGIYSRAKNGDMRAAEILISYRFGNPYAEPPTDHEIKPIHLIEVELSGRRERRYKNINGSRVEVQYDELTDDYVPVHPPPPE